MIGDKTDISRPEKKTLDPRITGVSDRSDDVPIALSHVVRIQDMSNSTEFGIGSPANSTLSETEKRSKTMHVVVGTALGIAVGYICATIGRLVIFLVGVVMIGLQFFEVPKRFLLDWRQMVGGARSFLQRTTKFDQTAVNLCQENQVFFGSFCGGFLIGLSFF